MEVSDEALVLACRRGDQQAWGILVKRYQRLIHSIARRAGLDEELSADVFQTVFTSLFERLDHLEHPDRLSAWLITTARRETWRTIVKRNRETSLSSSSDEEDESFDLPDDAPLAEAEMLRLEQQHQVRMAMTAIDERCKRLLTLLFYAPEPVAYTEVASQLGLPEGSIGPTRARCLQKLLRLLKKSGW